MKQVRASQQFTTERRTRASRTHTFKQRLTYARAPTAGCAIMHVQTRAVDCARTLEKPAEFRRPSAAAGRVLRPRSQRMTYIERPVDCRHMLGCRLVSAVDAHNPHRWPEIGRRGAGKPVRDGPARTAWWRAPRARVPAVYDARALRRRGPLKRSRLFLDVGGLRLG